MATKKICFLGILITLSLIFSYIDSLIIVIPVLPFIKLGLANICVLFCLYRYGSKEAFIVLAIRILLMGLIFTSLSSMLYSIAGGIIAFFTMYLLKKTRLFSIVSISMAGGVCHNVGQIMIAAYLLRTKAVIAYIPALIITGAVTGLLVGILSKQMIERIIIKD